MAWPTAKNYINFHLENVKNASLSQFKTCENYDTHGIPFDCMSIMNYKDKDFSNGNGLTMTARNKAICDLKSPKQHLTQTDIDLVNKIYNLQTPQIRTFQMEMDSP